MKPRQSTAGGGCKKNEFLMYIDTPAHMLIHHHTHYIHTRRPVAMLDRFSDFKEVVDKVNNSAYGLQTGVYTQNIHKVVFLTYKVTLVHSPLFIHIYAIFCAKYHYCVCCLLLCIASHVYDDTQAFYAFQNLHVGGVVINDVPSARVDSQPV